jgi:hypothetical protein
MLLMLEVIMIVSSAILERSLMTMYTICRRATYTEPVSLLIPFFLDRGWCHYVFMLEQFGDSEKQIGSLSCTPYFPTVQ